jgi:hypothetical protein
MGYGCREKIVFFESQQIYSDLSSTSKVKKKITPTWEEL